MLSRSLIITLATIALFALAGALTVFWALPVQKTLPALDERAKLLEGALNERRSLIDQARKGIAQVPSNLKTKLSSFLPVGSDVPNFIAGLDIIANREGVVVNLISIDEAPVSQVQAANVAQTPAAPDAAQLSARMSLKGSYQALRAFLDALGNNIRLTDVRTIALDAKAGPDVISMDLDMVTYYQGINNTPKQ